MSNPDRSAKAVNTYHHNRLRAIMLHTSRYSCLPITRMAKDSGVAKSTVSLICRGKTTPLYRTACCLVKCLEEALGRPLDLRDVFPPDQNYPTAFVCDLVGCPGCTPQVAYELRMIGQAGRWTGDTFEFKHLSELGGGGR